jgi:hypothetical protein
MGVLPLPIPAGTGAAQVLAAAGARVLKWQLSKVLGTDRRLGAGMMCLCLPPANW